MSFEIYGALSQGDVSCETRIVPGSDSGEYVDLYITLFSSRFPKIDFEIEYRAQAGDPWETDTLISGSTSGAVTDNVIRGASATADGSIAQIRWYYLRNGIAPGSNCEVRVKLLPFPFFFEKCRNTTSVEGGTEFGNPQLIASLSYQAVGIDYDGNWLCVDPTSAFVLSTSGSIIMTVTGMTYPSYMYAKQDGNYLILDTGASRIVEVDNTGATVRTWSGAGSVSSPTGMQYDEATGNLLVTGGSIPKAYEISWEADTGTVLWSFGQASSGTDLDELDSPKGICYGYNDRDKVIIADSGNNRVLIIDRSGSSDSVSPVSFISIGGVSVPLQSPTHVSSGEEDTILIVESEGRELLFSEERDVHPTLLRYLSSVDSSLGGSDSASPYRNVIYTPIPEVVK
jgi:hypothetical protein